MKRIPFLLLALAIAGAPARAQSLYDLASYFARNPAAQVVNPIYDLACASGSSPLQQTVVPATGHLRAWACVDGLGVVTLNGASGGMGGNVTTSHFAFASGANTLSDTGFSYTAPGGLPTINSASPTINFVTASAPCSGFFGALSNMHSLFSVGGVQTLCTDPSGNADSGGNWPDGIPSLPFGEMQLVDVATDDIGFYSTGTAGVGFDWHIAQSDGNTPWTGATGTVEWDGNGTNAGITFLPGTPSEIDFGLVGVSPPAITNDKSAKLAAGSVKLLPVAIGSLPSAATEGAGAIIPVNDAMSFTVGTCTGGGSDYMLAVSNGTTWTCH